MRSNFVTINEFFNTLTSIGINYLVLRNFENLLEPELFLDGHEDIDLLCENSDLLATSVGAIPCPPKSSAKQNDKIHYKIYVNDQPISLDLRQVGDGYFCERWERDLLKRRVKKDCFYVMNDEDHFFTLIYHAILQKRFFSEEYRSRLIQMSNRMALNVDDYSEKGFIAFLENYMREKGYCYSFSEDYMVPNRFHLVDKKLVSKNLLLQWYHFKFDFKVLVIEWLVRIKHLIYD